MYKDIMKEKEEQQREKDNVILKESCWRFENIGWLGGGATALYIFKNIKSNTNKSSGSQPQKELQTEGTYGISFWSWK